MVRVLILTYQSCQICHGLTSGRVTSFLEPVDTGRVVHASDSEASTANIYGEVIEKLRTNIRRLTDVTLLTGTTGPDDGHISAGGPVCELVCVQLCIVATGKRTVFKGGCHSQAQAKKADRERSKNRLHFVTVGSRTGAYDGFERVTRRLMLASFPSLLLTLFEGFRIYIASEHTSTALPISDARFRWVTCHRAPIPRQGSWPGGVASGACHLSVYVPAPCSFSPVPWTYISLSHVLTRLDISMINMRGSPAGGPNRIVLPGI